MGREDSQKSHEDNRKGDSMKPNEEVVWIETYTGRHVNPLQLKPEDIDIKDIAHSLSMLCRFVGHCKWLYTVGQHSIHVANLVDGARGINQDWTLEKHNRTCLAALLHDGGEVYLSDLSRPVKHSGLFKQYRELEKVVTGRIMERYGCTGVDWGLIKRMDDTMLATEAAHLMFSGGSGWYLPEPALSHDVPKMDAEEVEELFTERFFRYGGK